MAAAPICAGAVAFTSIVTVAPGARFGLKLTDTRGPLPPPAVHPVVGAQVKVTLLKAAGTRSCKTTLETGSLPSFFTVNVKVTAPPGDTVAGAVFPTLIDTQ